MSSQKPNGNATENGNGVSAPSQRLRLNANTDHKPDSYDDMVNLGFSPLLFSSLECYLPHPILNFPRVSKIHFMRDILTRYSPEGDRARKEYREKIASNYQPLHRELFTMHPLNFFVPSFLEAIKQKPEESFRHIMAEPVPGFVFEMLQPSFCEMLLAEVEHFERWVHSTRFRIMRPNTMNKYGVVLDDFGLEKMLDRFMNDFIRPLSEGRWINSGSHHGFVVEYGDERDVELGFHVDDAEVSLNVYLGKQFYGGELFFRGVRCDKHVNTETQPEEILDYTHVPGRAVLHRGRHRHGARATTSGNRSNLILWCRSLVFRELKKYQKDFSCWCGECRREKKQRQRMSIAATKMMLNQRISRLIYSVMLLASLIWVRNFSNAAEMCKADLSLSMDIMRSLLNAIEKSSKFNLVQRIYSLICHYDLKPNTETFTQLISLNVKMKDFDDAYGMLNDLRKLNLTPTICMYNAIIGGYFREVS